MKRILNKIIFIIYYNLLSFNKIAISKESFIHRTVSLLRISINGNVYIDEKSRIQEGVRINAQSFFKLGRYSVINGPNTNIDCLIHNVEIGSFCSIAKNVSIIEYTHYSERITTSLILKNIFLEKNLDNFSKGPVIIGNDVWIGSDCVILSGVTIGCGAIIASNSVVNRNVPPYAIVGGSPAKIIRYRFSQEIIDDLIKLKWWNWDIDKIINNKDIFSKSITKDLLIKAAIR